MLILPEMSPKTSPYLQPIPFLSTDPLVPLHIWKFFVLDPNVRFRAPGAPTSSLALEAAVRPAPAIKEYRPL